MPELVRCMCGALRQDGICPRCKNNRANNQSAAKRRNTPAERGYGDDWKKFRQRILNERKLCHDCNSRGVARFANEVHHIVKIKVAPERRLDESNVMALCKKCHLARTTRGE